MILVDTSVWIDHLHRGEPKLQDLLLNDEVAMHDGIIEEIALGSIRDRGTVIALLEALSRVPVLRHNEFGLFVDQHRLWGQGLSIIDVQLLGSARLSGSTIWTRDKRLRAAAVRLRLNAPFEE